MALSDFGLNPYVDFRTQTLHNKLGIDSADKLKEIESALTRVRISELKLDPLPGNYDLQHLKQIHAHLFQDVYAWAGKVREIFDAAKLDYIGGPVHRFTPAAEIEREATRIFDRLAQDKQLTGLPREEFVTKLAALHGELNQLHAFPEGNGRTQRLFLEDLAIRAGHPVNLSIGTEERIIQASIAQVKGDNGPMERFMREAADPERAQAVQKAVAFLEQHWGREKTAGAYIAATVPGETYAGRLVDRGGNDFMFRDDKGFIAIGHVRDLPASVKSGEHFEFMATSAQSLQRQIETAKDHIAPQQAKNVDRSGQEYDVLGRNLPEVASQYEFRRSHTGPELGATIHSFRHTATGGHLHIDEQGTFRDREAKPISREQALEHALHPHAKAHETGHRQGLERGFSLG